METFWKQFAVEEQGINMWDLFWSEAHFFTKKNKKK